MFSLLARLFILGASALGCATVMAQMFSPGYALSGAPMSNFLSTSYLTQSVSNSLASPSEGKSERRAAPGLRPFKEGGLSADLKARTAGPSLMPARMAQHYPAQQRPQAQALFEDLLARYAQVERQFEIPRGDLPGAVAAFLAGSWMGLHNADFPDAQFRPVVEQMRSILANNPQLQAAADTEKREMYEQMAILGMLMAGTQMGLKQKADAAIERNMRVTARAYLEQFLKTDADRVHMTAAGLVLR